MKALFAAVREDPEVGKAEEAWGGKKRHALIYGLDGAQRHAVFAAAYSRNPRPVLIVCSDRDEIEAWRDDLSSLLPESSVRVLPELDSASFRTAVKSLERQTRRMEALGCLCRGEAVIILAEPAAVAQKGISRHDFERMSVSLRVGDLLEREELLSRLVTMGYTNEPEIEHIGQFSARGGIVDIFPLNAEQPIRLEFFDDEIDSLREFAIDTGRSVRNLQEISLLPLMVQENKNNVSSCLGFLEAGTVIFDEPTRLREELQRRLKEDAEEKKGFFTWEEMLEQAQKHNVLFLSMLLQKLHGASPDELIHIKARAVVPYHRQLELLVPDIRAQLESKMRVLFLLRDEHKAQALCSELLERGLQVHFSAEPEELGTGSATIALGTLQNGFELPAANLMVVTEKDVLGRQKKALRPMKTDKAARINHFREIKVGDYIVHVDWGIGRYEGVETVEIDGIKHDFFQIRYGSGDKLSVPVKDVGLLQKYIGPEGEIPHLNRLGGTRWKSVKAKAKASVMDIAEELLELYAKRRKSGGFAYPADGPEQRDFEDAFEFTETPDQLAAIEEIKRDMERPEPMDRLLCGDVGFGKTEVAIRAAFKAVMSGSKQVAVLVPTTVLAMQHYQTFKERLDGMGVEVEVICRFNTPKEQRETLARLASGRVDILIGTHSLLNTDRMTFKDLGLLIVDEEQRFGVKQKEKIKKMAAGVDVLTLSATPIPRTLHMSLSGARDMSIIETPPSERMPVQTNVVEDDDDTLCKAIRRELRRGGQVYFVYNRVDSMEKMHRRLQELVPEARIRVGHGQMTGVQLERVMMEFYKGDIDILLATTIMENGLDVPNANTIIVYDADRFGLSQLYQMRGRVGRSRRMAFAYFVYHKDKVLSEVAEKRLQAMMDFAALGSGFKIAMRDLEIRGAGDLLGSQQHGHIAGVGFEMYCQLLDEAVQQLKTGEPVKLPHEPVINLQLDAYLDTDYISEPLHKLEIYRRLAAVRTEAELSSLTDELIDRFGDPPETVRHLLQVVRVKNYARLLGIASVVKKGRYLELGFSADTKVEGENIVRLDKILKGKMKLLPRDNVMVINMPPAWEDSICRVAIGVLRCLNGEEPAKKLTQSAVQAGRKAQRRK